MPPTHGTVQPVYKDHLSLCHLHTVQCNLYTRTTCCCATYTRYSATCIQGPLVVVPPTHGTVQPVYKDHLSECYLHMVQCNLYTRTTCSCATYTRYSITCIQGPLVWVQPTHSTVQPVYKDRLYILHSPLHVSWSIYCMPHKWHYNTHI